MDENLENYMLIHNWLRGLGSPESLQEFDDLLRKDDGIEDYKKQFSDGSLHILNSNFRNTAVVKFKDLFPTYLTSLEFESSETDINYFTAEVTFKYTLYDILGDDGKRL